MGLGDKITTGYKAGWEYVTKPLLKFGGFVLAGALFGPIGAGVGMLVGAVYLAYKSATTEGGVLNSLWQKYKNSGNTSTNEENKSNNDVEMQNMASQQNLNNDKEIARKNTTSEEERKKREQQAQQLREQLEQTELKQDQGGSFKQSIQEAFTTEQEKGAESAIAASTDNSVTFKNQDEAKEFLQELANKEEFLLGDGKGNVYYGDGKGNFYKGEKSGLEAFKQAVKEQQEHREQHTSKFDKVLSQMQTEGFTDALSSTNELHDKQEQEKDIEVDPLGGLPVTRGTINN